MSIQKKLRYYLGWGAIVFGVIVLLIHYLPPIPGNIPLITGQEVFWENVFLGVFSGIFIGFISSVVIYKCEKERACLILIRKVKFLENTIETFIDKGEVLKKANQRYDDIRKKLDNAQVKKEKENVATFQQELEKEEKNRKVLFRDAQEQVRVWELISSKANEIKEDYTFQDILAKKNDQHINEAIRLVQNIELRALRIKSILASGEYALIASIEIGICSNEINTCIKEIIEACFKGKKQEILKVKYMSCTGSKETDQQSFN